MQVNCIHGFFEFKENRPGEISDFMLLSKLRIVPRGTSFTFERLAEVPDHTIKGYDFLGAQATATHEGNPSDLFRANGLVYDFTKDALVPLSQSSLSIPLRVSGGYYLSTGGLIIPGSLTETGRVEGFSGFYSFSAGRWAYSEVTIV